MINIQTIGIQILAADATAAPASWEATLMSFAPMLLFIAAMYFFFVAPQRKQQKEREKLQSELAVGTEVILANGIFGKVHHLKDDRVTIELESGRMVVHKSAIVGKAEEAAKAIQA
jgi:preprotein translocase subunit YajC